VTEIAALLLVLAVYFGLHRIGNAIDGLTQAIKEVD
jgi:Sec-independent protein translocase protein TatA